MWGWAQIAGLTVLALLPLTTACSKQPSAFASNSPPPASSPQLPFDRQAADKGVSPTAGFVIPEIPLGTHLVVGLDSPLSSAQAHSGDSFAARLAQPVVVQGRTVVESGAAVTGKVIAGKAGISAEKPGFLRVTLSAININGQTVPVETSSVFAKGGPHGKSKAGPISPDGKFSTERRLTFRLEQAVSRTDGS